MTALNERRGGWSDRSADFRALARFFAQAPDDDAAHRLWRAAFVLTPACHLTVDATAEAAWRDADLPGTTPWAASPPLEISPRLRETGSYERRGRPTRTTDRSAARQLLVRHAEREAAQTAAARARLGTGGPVMLSALAGREGPDPEAFRLFLVVLGDALSARAPGESESSAVTADGTMEVRLKLADPKSVVRALTVDGVLSGPEHVIETMDIVPEASPAQSSALPSAPSASSGPPPRAAGVLPVGTQEQEGASR